MDFSLSFSLIFFLLLSVPFILIFPSSLLFSLILAWSPSVCASVCVHERPDSPLNWVVLIREQTFYFGDASAKMHGIKRAEGMLSCRWRGCVCMCYRLRSRFPFVCVCVWAERKKNTQCDWDKQRMVKKRTCVLWFQELYTEAVSIAKIWMCTIMWNPFSLTVNVCGCISISNYKIVCKMRIRVPQIIVHWSYSPSKATG